MKRIKHEYAVYFYAADGSTLKFEGAVKAEKSGIESLNDRSKVALDLLARLANMAENGPAQKYLEQIVLDKDDLDATTYKAGSLVVDRTESI